ncbi:MULTISPECIES: hypothetical protein [unclassified Streptomyces]|uniref:hypothetical protein n=1 Tax=unclassified Streptomyces TaxID=2593676 RepID=UPI00131ABE16|nr:MULTISPECIES: hypothetical protein [unclassified Streptomyces]
MREALSHKGQQIDARDEIRLGHLSGAVRKATEQAAEWRRHAALGVTEQERRQLLATTQPDLHRTETIARQAAADAQQRQQAAVQAHPEPSAAVTPVQQQGPRMSC